MCFLFVLKVFIEFVTILLLLFVFCFSGLETWEILEPTPLPWKAKA